MSATSRGNSERVTPPSAQPTMRTDGWLAAPELQAYRLLTRLACPAAKLILRYRLRRGKEELSRLGERLGQSSHRRPNAPLIWIHAASVGEASSVLPLISEIGQRRGDVAILLTTGTVTSARMVASRLPPNAIHQYVPLDAPQLVARFLDHWRPNLAVFTEQEIWPNLIVETSARAIPMAIVNGRMSADSHMRWQRRRRLAGALFNRFHLVLAQSEATAVRFRSLGAHAARDVGNLKIDAPPLPVDIEALNALQFAIGSRPILVAASTHEGEELIVADAHQKLAKKFPGFLTIIAPRHPDRGTELMNGLSSKGLRVVNRTSGALPSADTDIYLADTIGELGTLYAATSVAFIGGSLIPHGGQNPIEAVRHGAVVLTGPSQANFAESYDALLASGGTFLAETAEAIAACTEALHNEPERLHAAREKARDALAAMSGALERTLHALLPMLPEPTEKTSAL